MEAVRSSEMSVNFNEVTGRQISIRDKSTVHTFEDMPEHVQHLQNVRLCNKFYLKRKSNNNIISTHEVTYSICNCSNDCLHSDSILRPSTNKLSIMN
jgi:hypothetical protein